MNAALTIRDSRPDDARAIADIFHGAIHRVGPEHYTQAELDAWSPEPVDYRRWSERQLLKRPYVAERNGDVVGFIELDPDGHIDCMYTHPDHQRSGVASALYAHVLRIAREKGASRLYVEASHFARPFFEKQGFQLRREKKVALRGQSLTNFDMELTL